MNVSFWRRVPFYPLLVGLYPVLYLWAANYALAPAFVVVRPLLLSLALTLLLWLICWALFRDWRKASLAVLLPLGLFFLYGRVADVLLRRKVFGILIGSPPVLLGAWGLIFAAVLLALARTRSKLYELTLILNLTTGFVFVLVLGQIGAAFVTEQIALRAEPGPSGAARTVTPASPDAPDVYYILLDGYDRQDLLLADIGFDNRDFIARLEQLGFVFPECSQSNYNYTSFSVASALNMNYLDQLGFSYSGLAGKTSAVDPLTVLTPLIQNNAVMQQFQQMGYQVITFQQPYHFLNFPKSDRVLSNSTSEGLGKTETAQFEDLFARTTLLQLLIPNFLLEQKYQLDLFQLDQLERIPQIPGKKFIYAHLMVTHQDFAFTASGERRPFVEESPAAYADQVSYANRRIVKIVENILAQSAVPPVIILQADHGFGFVYETGYDRSRGPDQFKILNAYYLPQPARAGLYPQISPINTFRLVLSQLFKADYPLLPDRSIRIHPQFAEGYAVEAGSCVR